MNFYGLGGISALNCGWYWNTASAATILKGGRGKAQGGAEGATVQIVSQLILFTIVRGTLKIRVSTSGFVLRDDPLPTATLYMVVVIEIFLGRVAFCPPSQPLGLGMWKGSSDYRTMVIVDWDLSVPGIPGLSTIPCH